MMDRIASRIRANTQSSVSRVKTQLVINELKHDQRVLMFKRWFAVLVAAFKDLPRNASILILVVLTLAALTFISTVKNLVVQSHYQIMAKDSDQVYVDLMLGGQILMKRLKPLEAAKVRSLMGYGSFSPTTEKIKCFYLYDGFKKIPASECSLDYLEIVGFYSVLVHGKQLVVYTDRPQPVHVVLQDTPEYSSGRDLLSTYTTTNWTSHLSTP